MNLPNSALKAPRTGEGSAAHSAQDVASSPVGTAQYQITNDKLTITSGDLAGTYSR